MPGAPRAAPVAACTRLPDTRGDQIAPVALITGNKLTHSRAFTGIRCRSLKPHQPRCGKHNGQRDRKEWSGPHHSSSA
jgi:hypothetical protein